MSLCPRSLHSSSFWDKMGSFTLDNFWPGITPFTPLHNLRGKFCSHLKSQQETGRQQTVRQLSVAPASNCQLADVSRWFRLWVRCFSAPYPWQGMDSMGSLRYTRIKSWIWEHLHGSDNRALRQEHGTVSWWRNLHSNRQERSLTLLTLRRSNSLSKSQRIILTWEMQMRRPCSKSGSLQLGLRPASPICILPWFWLVQAALPSRSEFRTASWIKACTSSSTSTGALAAVQIPVITPLASVSTAHLE